MNAIYPAAVRSFPEHADGVEYVDASHVNNLQDEVAAIERTVGIQPQSYAPVGQSATVYATVGSRLDAHEADLAGLQTQVDTLLSAAQSGWATPVMTLKCTSLTPVVQFTDPYSFIATAPRAVVWNLKLADTATMWSGGATATCAKGGLWQIAASFAGPVDFAGFASAQTANNALQIIPVPIAVQSVALALSIAGVSVASAKSALNWAPSALLDPDHSVNVSWTGAMSTGQVFQILAGQRGGSVSGVAALSATYLRALPGVS